MNEVFLPPAELKPPPNTPMLPIEEKEATERKPSIHIEEKQSSIREPSMQLVVQPNPKTEKSGEEGIRKIMQQVEKLREEIKQGQAKLFVKEEEQEVIEF